MPAGANPRWRRCWTHPMTVNVRLERPDGLAIKEMLANPKRALDDHLQHALWMREVMPFDPSVLRNEEGA
jgi:hypothetical protein